jgi:lycopene beta-cyclase
MMTISRFTAALTSGKAARKEWLQYGLIAAWVLTMIMLPIVRWTLGTDNLPHAVTFALLVQFAAVFTICHSALGRERTLAAFGIVAAATWAVEAVGSATGFPFGSYDYTDVLQPQLAHVPLLIPLAWFMMLPSAWAVAEVLAGRHRWPLYVAVSALALTAWDLFLDPQMVAWGFWVWENPSGYFGIPWTNYAGWLLTGALITLLVRPYRFRLPVVPLLVVYGVVLCLQTIGQAVFWNQPGPALVGALAMGSLLLLAVRSYAQRKPRS